jgi:hypothetical protein
MGTRTCTVLHTVLIAQKFPLQPNTTSADPETLLCLCTALWRSTLNVETQIHAFGGSVLDGGEWSASTFGRFTTQNRVQISQSDEPHKSSRSISEYWTPIVRQQWDHFTLSLNFWVSVTWHSPFSEPRIQAEKMAQWRTRMSAYLGGWLRIASTRSILRNLFQL